MEVSHGVCHVLDKQYEALYMSGVSFGQEVEYAIGA